MKNINKIFNAITINLLVLTAIGLAGTFLSDYLISINWFGDYKEVKNYYGSEKTFINNVWGARHYWYNWGCGLLFLTGFFRCVCNIIKIADEQPA